MLFLFSRTATGRREFDQGMKKYRTWRWWEDEYWPSVCDLFRKRVLALGWSDGLASWASSVTRNNESSTQTVFKNGTISGMCRKSGVRMLDTHRQGAPGRWCAAGRSRCLHSRPPWWWWDTPPAPPLSCGSWDSPLERCSRTPSLPWLTYSGPATAHTTEGGGEDHLLLTPLPLQLKSPIWIF